jgi:hypothetical protein
MAKKLTPAKAREILHDKSVHGHPLTDKQRKFFGAMSKENIMQNGGRKTNKKTIDNKIETLQKFMKDTSFLKELQSRPIPSEFNPNKNTTFNSNNIPPTDRVLQRELEEVDKNKTPGGISTWNVSVNPSTTKYWTPPKQKNGGWLDKFDSGGTMQEYQENYNDYSVSAPEGFQGDGYSNVGRNYSPAWGGQFAMGGSLPGAVGFTYARTAGAAPSEGPYAKKTLPSAQDGRAVADATYVKPPVILPIKTSTGPIKQREDFKPWWNWASKQAGDVDRRQNAYGKLGDLYAYYAGQPLQYDVLEHSKYKPTSAKNSKANYISINDPKFKQEVFDKYNEVFVNKGAENQTFLTERERDRLKSTKINDNTYAVSGYTSLTEDEYKNVKQKNLDPIKVKGSKHVSNAIGRYFISKGKDEKGDYISYYDTFDEGSGPDGGGVGETLGLTKPFEIYDRIYLDPKTGKPKLENGGSMSYYQEGLDWQPKMISRDGTELAQQGKLLPKIGSKEYYQSADVRPMGDNTRTVSPSRTAELDAQVKKAQEEYAKKNIRRDELRALTPKESNEREIAKRNEEWRKKNLTMIPGVESEYEKTNRWKEENKEHDEEVANVQSAKAAFQNKGAYTFPTGATKNWNEMDAREKAYVVGKTQSRSFEVFPEATSNQPVKTTINSLNPLPVINKWVENFATAPYVARETDSYMPYVAAVADPAITLGALAIANPELASGELFTKQLLNPKKPFQNIIKGVAAFEEGELSSYLANKLQKDAIKSTGKSVISTTKTNAKDLANVPEASLKAKFLNGGEHNVIKDNLGQWAHPGEITEIGSNEITMEGVPYDVLGVSDKGDVKLMKPGKNYKFKGKKVTEYPVAKNGVNQQDQKTLEQLDQLTNFTNYNKPQPGGWLNKYN